MLQLAACVKETCDGLEYVDTTLNYNAETRPGGYGSPNPVDGPADFDTLVFSLWLPGVDPATTPTPSVTVNLLTDVPAQAADQTYTWPVFTFEQLGVTIVESGVGYVEVVGYKDGEPYRNDFNVIFTKELYDILKVKRARWLPGTPMKPGCMPVSELWNSLQGVMCGGICSTEESADIIAWIRSNLNNICC